MDISFKLHAGNLKGLLLPAWLFHTGNLQVATTPAGSSYHQPYPNPNPNPVRDGFSRLPLDRSSKFEVRRFDTHVLLAHCGFDDFWHAGSESVTVTCRL